MFPIVIYDLLKGKCKLRDKIKRTVTLGNIGVPLLMLLVFGLFYIAGGQTSDGFGLYFHTLGTTKSKFLMNYLLFFFTEVGVYLLAMGTATAKYPFCGVVVAELAIFPFFIVRDNNFIMRGSIPALFILMTFIIKFLLEKQKDHTYRVRKIILVILLVIGARTPSNEIIRSINYTANNEDVVNREISSFSHIESEKEQRIFTADSQFFVHDYEDKLFFKYIAKKSFFAQNERSKEWIRYIL